MGKTLWGASPLGIAVSWLEKELFGIRQSARQSAPPPVLATLTLSATTFAYGVPSVGTVVGLTSGSGLSVSGVPAGLVITVADGTWRWDGTNTASTGSLTLIETLNGAVGSPKASTVNWTITGVAPPVLNTLSLSSDIFVNGTAASGTIVGATALSTITASGLPTGLTIDGAARTWAWSGSGTVSTGSFTLTETLSGAVGSPLVSTISYTIAGSTPLGGNGTLSAPELGYPSGGVITTTVPNDWQSGDVYKLAYSSSEDMSSPTFLLHTLSDSDTPGSSISIGVPTGTHYFVGYGSHLGADSQYLSNKVKSGDTTNPTWSTSATQTPNELTQFAILLTLNETASKFEFVPALDDQTLFEFYTSGTDTYVRPYGNGTFDRDNPTDANQDNGYSFTIRGYDLAGNYADQTFTVTPAAVDKTATAPSFTTVTGATVGTDYQTPDYQVTSIASGIILPANATCPYSKDSGVTWNAAGSFTVALNDTVRLKQTAIVGGSTATLTIGSGSSAVSGTWTVADNSVTGWKIVVTNNIHGNGGFAAAEIQFQTANGTPITGGTPFGADAGSTSFNAAKAADGSLTTYFLAAATNPAEWGETFTANSVANKVKLTAPVNDGIFNKADDLPTAFTVWKFTGGSWVQTAGPFTESTASTANQVRTYSW